MQFKSFETSQIIIQNEIRICCWACWNYSSYFSRNSSCYSVFVLLFRIIVQDQFGNQGVGLAATLQGVGNTWVGDENSIVGVANEVLGTQNQIVGQSNAVEGGSNIVSGQVNVVDGSGNQVIGTNNVVQG